MKPLISICIPAYQRISYLKRLLDSIKIQTFKNFEVIITDDSPSEEVLELCKNYNNDFYIVYKKNLAALGTPANWNEAIRMAKGEWIKLMHDDDWFNNSSSLQRFADATQGGAKFIFCAYVNFFEKSLKQEKVSFPQSWRESLIKRPMMLMVENVIGPPSVTMVHNTIAQQYDELMKWRVDIDFYLRILSQEKDFFYIESPLINVGISESQVTNSCLNVPEVEIPEGFLLLHKYGTTPLKNIRIYDAWWRMLRNTGVRKLKHLQQHTPQQEWPDIIKKMVADESHLPISFLKVGAISKLAMGISYLKNKKYA